MLGKLKKHKFFTFKTLIINLQVGNSKVLTIFSSLICILYRQYELKELLKEAFRVTRSRN